MNTTNIKSITNKVKVMNYQKKNSHFFKGDFELNSLYLNKLYLIKQSQKMGKNGTKVPKRVKKWDKMGLFETKCDFFITCFVKKLTKFKKIIKCIQTS